MTTGPAGYAPAAIEPSRLPPAAQEALAADGITTPVWKPAS